MGRLGEKRGLNSLRQVSSPDPGDGFVDHPLDNFEKQWYPIKVPMNMAFISVFLQVSEE